MCAVKYGVHRVKQRVDFHNIAAQMLLVIDNPIFSVCVAGYKRSLYIFGNFLHRLLSRFKFPMMHQFIFGYSPKAFHRSVSQQLPLRLMEAVMPNCFNRFW